jgi:predicted Rossmann fold nucleotide-binding protein DprA/Smf involved in DNA uptake
MVMVRKIISGGQTGVDRAALDFALDHGISTGGWLPRGRLAEDGALAESYPNMKETASPAPEARTRLNVLDSDATLIIVRGPVAGGTLLTVEAARSGGKPLFIADLSGSFGESECSSFGRWLAEEKIETLNVAGPKESEDPGIYDAARAFLSRLFADDNTPETERPRTHRKKIKRGRI